ncbi:MAG: hypothetical protein V1720_15855 [bacterium]
MLAITLDYQHHQNTSTKHHTNQLNFELKVVNDGLFTEVRLSFPKKKNQSEQNKLKDKLKDADQEYLQ